MVAPPYVSLNSPLLENNLVNNITKINNKNISDLKDFYELLAKESEKKLVFTVNRNGQTVETLAYVRK